MDPRVVCSELIIGRAVAYCIWQDMRCACRLADPSRFPRDRPRGGSGRPGNGHRRPRLRKAQTMIWRALDWVKSGYIW